MDSPLSSAGPPPCPQGPPGPPVVGPPPQNPGGPMLPPSRPTYCTPNPVPNIPENNQVKLLEYRGAKIAAFTVEGRELICLPQAFELFLKHLVGGLHTVYTKLKRLEVTPVVCNVEQVRILRGLGAIQPGVNRCKLIAPKEFDILYEDCTNSSARPGRPPKRSTTASPDQQISDLSKRNRFEPMNRHGDLAPLPLKFHHPNLSAASLLLNASLCGISVPPEKKLLPPPAPPPPFSNGYYPHYPPHLGMLPFLPFSPPGHSPMQQLPGNNGPFPPSNFYYQDGLGHGGGLGPRLDKDKISPRSDHLSSRSPEGDKSNIDNSFFSDNPGSDTEIGPNKEEALEKIAQVHDTTPLNGASQSRCSSVDSKEHALSPLSSESKLADNDFDAMHPSPSHGPLPDPSPEPFLDPRPPIRMDVAPSLPGLEGMLESVLHSLRLYMQLHLSEKDELTARSKSEHDKINSLKEQLMEERQRRSLFQKKWKKERKLRGKLEELMTQMALPASHPEESSEAPQDLSMHNGK